MSKKIILMQGLPASGKSSYAKELVNSSGNTFRVNKDDLRSMILCGTKWNYKKEDIVVEAEFFAAKSILTAGFNVVVDDTNLSPKVRNKWEQFANGHQAKIEIVSFLDVPLDECIRRDALREVSVGRTVIENMALKNGLVAWNSYDKLAVYDLDGTLANIEHRRHHVMNGSKNWPAFFEGCINDPIRPEVVEMLNKDIENGMNIIILSGRPKDTCGDATVQWLAKHDIMYDRIFMREGGDSRQDTIIKKEILDLMPKNKIKRIVDDRPCVLRTWTEEMKNHDVEIVDVGTGEEF